MLISTFVDESLILNNFLSLTVYVNFYFRRSKIKKTAAIGLTVYVNFYFRRFGDTVTKNGSDSIC